MFLEGVTASKMAPLLGQAVGVCMPQGACKHLKWYDFCSVCRFPTP